MIDDPAISRVITVASATELRSVQDVLRRMDTPPPCMLLSPDGAGCLLGPAWWRALLAQTGCVLPAFLDCGASAGRAVEALGLGVRHILLDGSCPQARTVGLLAGELGAVCLGARPVSHRLDLDPAPIRLERYLRGR
ncbi:hypothetical protein AAC691_11715 [Nguyenibacter vanlangensis]|uniref:Uncharacterized protein n=2 Tax=Nguyenibacter vanlangensis TaxID=1216886 RepID=A0ABZ3CZR4_9PROT